MKIDITAIITGMKYTPLLCRELETFNVDELERAISQDASFILRLKNGNEMAFSWWVSAKRTRSYPYARVYDTLKFVGKKVTLIPVIKDEGFDGDRDFIQWDTVSLMSLLGIYVIISYYKHAEKNLEYKHKITEQKYDIAHVKQQISSLVSYQSDALHWNLSQAQKVPELARLALQAYSKISKKLKVKMHSNETAQERIQHLLIEKDAFMTLSRDKAKSAQQRERLTIHSTEKLTGVKGTLTINNYLGGSYYFTADEAELYKNDIYIVEGKHTKENRLPSLGDIKDGLLKMILNTNLSDVKVNGTYYNPIPVLKLTTGSGFDMHSLAYMSVVNMLKKEAKINNFRLKINEKIIS